MRLPDCVMEELEKDRGIGAVERALYLLAWAYDPPTITRLADIANISRNKASRACKLLAARGWMKLIKHPKGTLPAAVIPHRCQIVMAHELENEYDMVQFKGEFLARKRMDWCLVRDEYICNARPKILTHPVTKKPLELDTFDPKNCMGTEYNGSQHYRETEDYKQVDVDEQQVRDHLKASMSAQNGITLLTFTYRDLRPGVLERRLEEAVPHLKRRYVDMGGPYMKVLNRISDAYAAKVERAEKEAEQAKAAQQKKASEQRNSA